MANARLFGGEYQDALENRSKEEKIIRKLRNHETEHIVSKD